jgi:hypothetical protein
MAPASRHNLSVTDGRQAVVLRAAYTRGARSNGTLAKGPPVVTGPSSYTPGQNL